MSGYKFDDYTIFEDGCTTVDALRSNLSTNIDVISKCNTELSNESVFMGPICDSCVEGFGKINTLLNTMDTNFDTVSSYLSGVSTSYKNGDDNASYKVLNVENGVASTKMLSSAVLTGNSNQDKIYNYLKEQGFNNAAISGILANMEYESGFNPNIYGDGGTSYGICQWHAGRFTRLKNYCSNNGLDYQSLEGQLSYLVYELKDSYPDVYNTIINVPNTQDGAYTAAYKWTTNFEIPENKEAQGTKRGNTAKSKYWSTYGNSI